MSRQPGKRRGLATWLASSDTPLFVVDGRRRVVFFNTGCERLTGWTAGDVIGQVCDFVSQPDHTQVEALTGALCPPPEVFDGQEQAVPAHVLTRSGDRVSQVVRFIPLRGDDQQVDRVLGTFAPLPQRSMQVPSKLEHPLHAELSALRSEISRRYGISTLIGRTPGLCRLLGQLELACRHTGSVHIQGEPGTGKEHLARLVHFEGESRRRAFVPLDAMRLTRTELTETVKQALRDARDPEPTRLTPGTLYFKHADRLPDNVQDLLLEECGRPLPTRFPGRPEDAAPAEAGSESGPALRLMSSSLTGLDAAVREDRLSEEFCHLLTTQQMHIPPLRDRADDLPLLAQHFLEVLNRDQDAQASGFVDDVWAAFRKYAWPGNLDELRAVVTEARENCDQHTIRLSDLPFRFRAGVEAQSVSPSRPVEIVPLDEKLAAVERESIRLALEQAGDNKSQAAQLLGMTRPRLYRRMQILGLIDGDRSTDQ